MSLGDLGGIDAVAHLGIVYRWGHVHAVAVVSSTSALLVRRGN